MTEGFIHNISSHLQNMNTNFMKYSLKLLLLTRIALQLVGMLARVTDTKFHRQIYISGFYWLDFWSLWDGTYFISIALNDYSDFLNYRDYAFFPFYPLMIALFFPTTKTCAIIIGFLISNLALFCSSILLFHIIKMDYEEEYAMRAVKYLYIFPYSMLLSGIYSESLFLFLILCTVYSAKNNKWFLSGIFGYFAAITKITGILLLIYLGYEYLRQKNYDLAKVRLSILSLIIPIFGPLSVMYFNYVRTENMFTFIIIQRTNWDRLPINPLLSLYKGLVITKYPYKMLTSYVIFAAIILLVVFSRKIGYEYFVWAMFMIFTPLLSAWNSIGWVSLPRQLLVVFPLYITFSFITRGRNWDRLFTLLSTISLLVMTFIWANGVTIVV